MFHRPTTHQTGRADVMLSKKLTWLLRHGALKEGVQIQPNGFIKVDDILKHHNYRHLYTLDTLKTMAKNDAKQRFALRQNPEEGFWEIRANQGHTLSEVKAEECLHLISNPNEVPLAVHGTYYRHWPSIRAQGLRRMTRNHVHFAASDARADNISGFRGDCQVLIYLNVKKVLEEDRLKLYRSDNNVVLCSGLEEGCIPCKYFEKVVERKSGKLLEF